MTNQPKDDPLGRLAEVMVEDILETPRTELLAEVAEDHGDAHALSAEFERLVAPIMGRTESTRANLQAPAHENAISRSAATHVQQRSVGPRSGFSLIGWLQTLQERVFFNPRGTWVPRNFRIATASLLVFAVTASAALLIVKEFSRNSLKDAAPPISQSKPPLSPRHEGADFARETIIEVAEGRTEEEARANYRALQMKFPSILQARNPLILPSGRVGYSGDHHYLAAVGPFATSEQAAGLCNELRASGAQCVTRDYSR